MNRAIIDDPLNAPLKGIPAPKVKFTRQDAADISTLVNRAPLQNMKEAGAVAQLLMRFEQWVIQQGRLEPDPVVASPAPQAAEDVAEQTGEASPQ